MGKRGPQRKPTKLRLLTGNAGHRPINENEPEPPLDDGSSPPFWLTELETKAWHELVDMLQPLGMFTVADRISLSLICEMLVKYQQMKSRYQRMADDDDSTYGVMMKTRSGNVVQNPMVGAMNKLRSHLSRELQKFGMDPSSRSQIEVAGQLIDPIMAKYGIKR